MASTGTPLLADPQIAAQANRNHRRANNHLPELQGLARRRTAICPASTSNASHHVGEADANTVRRLLVPLPRAEQPPDTKHRGGRVKPQIALDPDAELRLNVKAARLLLTDILDSMCENETEAQLPSLPKGQV